MTLWINGDWVTGQGERRVKKDPVQGNVLWEGHDADAAQVMQAARAARTAGRCAASIRWSISRHIVVVEAFAPKACSRSPHSWPTASMQSAPSATAAARSANTSPGAYTHGPR